MISASIRGVLRGRAWPGHPITVMCMAVIFLLVTSWLVRDSVVAYLSQPLPIPYHIRLPLHILSKLGQLAVPSLVGMAFALEALRPVGSRRKVMLCVLLLAWCVAVTFGPRMGNLGVDSLRELGGANWHEALEFLDLFVLTPGYRGRDVLLSTLPCMTLLALGWRFSTARFSRSLRMAQSSLNGLLLLTLVAGIGLYIRAQWDESTLAKVFDEEAQRLAVQMRPQVVQQINVVLYIGESTSALHQSLLGYARPTNAPLTPWLQDLLVFSDVLTVHSFTREVLTRALSVALDPLGDQLLAERDLRRANVIQLLNRSGVGTHWYSNHGRAGSWDYASQLFGKAAKHSHFLNFEVANATFDERRFDHELLPLLERSMQSATGSNLFVLHSYAGHHDYCRNIPPSARQSFDDAQTRTPWTGSFGRLHTRDQDEHRKSIDCYDSAMRYVSENLARVMEMAKAQTQPTVVLYFADHGEDPLGGTSHDAALPRLSHLTVPMYFYANQSAQLVMGDKLRNAARNAAHPYSLGWLADSLLDLFGLRLDDRPLQSVFNPELRALPRYALLRHELLRGRSIVSLDKPDSAVVDRSDDTMRLARLYRSLDPASQKRLCVHRNNSLYKFMISTFVASCVEIDISIDVGKQTVHAYHPPHADNGLRLLDVIDSGGGRLESVWLDVKNAEPEALGVLYQQLAQVRLKHPQLAIMVEIQPGLTVSPGQVAVLKAMRAFSRVSTTFYLPAELGETCRASADAGRCEEALAAISRSIALGGFEGVSFDTSLLGVARRLPEYAKLRRHVWGDVPRPDPRNTEFNTVLVPIETDFDY